MRVGRKERRGCEWKALARLDLKPGALDRARGIARKGTELRPYLGWPTMGFSNRSLGGSLAADRLKPPRPIGTGSQIRNLFLSGSF